MATTNPTVYRLSIALIVFVLLTFILTITTYLFFKQRTDEQAKSQVAEKATADKQEALLASQAETQKLREFIGAAEGDSLESIETNLNNLFAKDFAGFAENDLMHDAIPAGAIAQAEMIDVKARDLRAHAEVFLQAERLQ